MTWGGARKGSGRPKGSGKYKEPTQAVRLPVSLVKILKKAKDFNLTIPLYSSKVSAGFPSPAEDYIADNLNLHDYLIKRPASTFLVRAMGRSMINAGIHENDILIVDRSITPTHGKVVVAVVDGQLTVKRLFKKSGKYLLKAENPDYASIEINEENGILIWGVVTNVIHSV